MGWQEGYTTHYLLVPQILKQDRLHIAFGSTGKDSDNDFAAILLTTRLLQGCPGHGPAADADG